MFGFNRKTEIGKRGEQLPETHEGLPDSHRPNGLCPRCGKQSSFDILGSLPVTFDSFYLSHRDGTQQRTIIDRVSSLICRHCGHGVVVVEEEWVGDKPRTSGSSSGEISFRGIHWWPLPESNLSSDIPEFISQAFSEALTCLTANCPRASAVMARRVLEAITVDKGEEKGTLVNRLATLSQKGVLLPTLADWAKEVRLIGNQGAHYDPLQPVNTEDAKQLLSFLRELLKYLYELPADLKRRREKQ